MIIFSTHWQYGVYGEDVHEHLAKSKDSLTTLCGIGWDGKFYKTNIKTFPSHFCFQCVVLYREGYVGSSYANLSRGYESPKKGRRDPDEVDPRGYVVSLLRRENGGIYFYEEWTGRELKRHPLTEEEYLIWYHSLTSSFMKIGEGYERGSVTPVHIDDIEGYF